MRNESESLLLGAACVGAGVLILCLAKPLDGSIVLIALIFLLVGMVFVATNAILIWNKIEARRQQEQEEEARRALEKQLGELEARKKAGLLSNAEYRAKRKELLRNQ